MNKPNTLRLLLVWALIILLAGCVEEKTLKVPSSQAPEGYEEIRYFLLPIPSQVPQERFPLILVLHGTGSDGWEYLYTWKDEAEKRRVMIIAPTRGRAYHNDPGDLQIFYHLIKEVSIHYPVDRNRIFLAGVSSGALVARWLATARPSFWKGVILVASPTQEDWPSQLKGSDFPPTLLIHGEKDDQFDFRGIVRHVETLKNHGVKVTLLSRPDAGHEHRPEWNREIFDWIEAELTPRSDSSFGERFSPVF